MMKTMTSKLPKIALNEKDKEDDIDRDEEDEYEDCNISADEFG